MALKPDRLIKQEYVGAFLTDITNGGKRGGVVVATGVSASGAGMDLPTNGAHYAAAPSGRFPLGVLMNDFVNNDLTKLPLNYLRSESQVGDKATLARDGYVVTNMVDATNGNPVRGDEAYVGPSGLFTKTNLDDTAGKRLKVGSFLTNKDEDGYWKVAFNIR